MITHLKRGQQLLLRHLSTAPPPLPRPPPIADRRVVVTGLGAVTPFGHLQPTWEALLAGKTATRTSTQLASSDLALPTHVVASIPDSFDPAPYLTNARAQSVPFIALALAAATEALQDAGLITTNHDETQTVTENDNHHVLSVPERTGVAIGAGVGSLAEVTSSHTTLETRGLRRLTPYFVPRTLINLAAGHVSMKFNLRGPNHSCATACATGAHSVGDAYRFVRFGDADVMVAGGTESTIDPLSIAGFSRVKALSTGFNENPSVASRPFDKRRDGFVMGEGSGVLVLEEYEHAKRRGAKIYAEIRGYGLSGDAHHITAPASDGRGAIQAMKSALLQSGLSPNDVAYINAHATSTPMGDAIEARAIHQVFHTEVQGLASARESLLKVSSTKGATGHLLGAAGAVEAIFAVLALHHKVAPPTANLHDIDDDAPTELNFVPLEAQPLSNDARATMTNSFGFGGTNASLVFGQI
jgi:3-oxoacyl-[acyl-carrier-protein] synthase II